MTKSELKELYNKSQNLNLKSVRKLIIEYLVIDFIKKIEKEYQSTSNIALSIIIKNKLRYGMLKPDSFYWYFANRLSEIGVRINENWLYRIRVDLPDEFSFETLDSYVDNYFKEKTSYSLRKTIDTNETEPGQEEIGLDSAKNSILPIEFAKYSKYIVYAIIGLAIYYLFLKK